MLEVGGGHEFVFVANRVLGNIDAVRDDFGLPERAAELQVFESLRNTESSDLANEWRRKASEIVRRSFLAGLGVDAVHTTSLFEGYGDDTCAAVTRGNDDYLEAVTLYDLIPYTFPGVYLGNPRIRNWYYERLGHMRRADLLLAISEFSAAEACMRLGLRRENVVNISGAADAHFRPLALSEEQRNGLLAKYGLRRFIMYTGGIDHRKNIERLIEAYARLPATLVATLQLAIVCKVHPEEKRRLGELARSLGLKEDRLVMTGFIPDDDLVALYNTCDLFVFPSWCEGFGLPALEAMQCGAPVIAADASSLPEVVGRTDALFNPLDVASITTKMAQVLGDQAFREDLRSHGIKRASGFTWKESARRALEAMEESHDRRLSRHAARPQGKVGQDRRPRLAFISPLPPDKSGIAAYSAELLPFLEEYYRITLVVPDGRTDDAYLQANMPVRDLEWFREHAEKFEHVVYQFGNSAFHAHMFDLLDEIPGTVVLHDFWLSGVVAYLQLTGKSPGFWDEQLYYSHGWRALVDRSTDSDDDVRSKYPANRRVLDMASGVIVHSQRTIELMQDWYGARLASRAVHIPILRALPVLVDKTAAKLRLGHPAEARLLCTFGFLDATKYSLEIAEAFLASELAKDPCVKLVMVGANPETVYGEAIDAIVARSKGKISVTGFVEQEDYSSYLQAAEAAVQLRRGTRGETSAAALDCLANGTALLINRNPAFAGIPDEAALVLEDEFSGNALSAALEQLMLEDDGRRLRVDVGVNYLRENCDPAKIARLYHESIQAFERSSPRLRAARACKDLLDVDAGILPLEADLRASGDAIRGNVHRQGGGNKIHLDSELLSKVDREALLLSSPGRETADAFRIELVRMEGSSWVCDRKKMSSWLGLAPPLADIHVDSEESAMLVLDASSMLRKAGGSGELEALLQSARLASSNIWFYWAGDALPRTSLAVLELAAHFVTGVIAEDGTAADALARELEWILSAAGRETMNIAYPHAGESFLQMLVRSATISGDADSARNMPEAGIRQVRGQEGERVWIAGRHGLSSQVGQWHAGAFSSTGNPGFLVFGPYATVKQGRYRLRILGEVPNGGSTEQAWYDVTSGQGQRSILERAPLLREKTGLLAERELTLDSAVDDLEIRLWVGTDEALEFQAFRLTQL